MRRSLRLQLDHSRHALRRSLRVSTAEGIVAELVGACSIGGAITAWALYLDLAPVLVGVLGALPFAAQLVQIPSAWLTQVHGSRRTALWTIGIGRQVPIVLAFLPWLPLSQPQQRAVLLAVVAATSLLSVAGNNAWTTWVGELVPDRLRGRYFGRRTAFCALGSTLGALAAGLALDHARPGPGAGAVLSALALISCVLGGVTVALLRRQQDPGNGPSTSQPTLGDAVKPWTDPIARRALTFHVAWAAAGGVAAAFYPIHMIANLRMGFARLAVYNGAVAAVRIVAAPLWGRALDRVGARPVLVACCFGLCLSPVLWLFPREGLLWPLAIDAPLCGVLLAGQALASFSLPLNVSSRGTRSFHVAAFAAAGGLATGVASAAGGALAHVLPSHLALLGQPLMTVQVLFLIGAALRFSAAGLALRIVEPGARPVQALGQLALNGALRRGAPRPRLDPGCALPVA
ncbi:MAG TPA: MFS transporter [Myxococcales bacterium]|nr:MFS transporter [Myxococcales bacterium]